VSCPPALFSQPPLAPFFIAFPLLAQFWSPKMSAFFSLLGPRKRFFVERSLSPASACPPFFYCHPLHCFGALPSLRLCFPRGTSPQCSGQSRPKPCCNMLSPGCRSQSKLALLFNLSLLIGQKADVNHLLEISSPPAFSLRL